MNKPAIQFDTVIGLEVHAQLATASKLFCGCSTTFGASPNESTCPVCLGLPGALPVLNRQVVEMAVMAGLATGCTIAPHAIFARKNYFYPDLPKGYQISQYELPICANGRVEIDIKGQQKQIGLVRIHMEEDAGKLLHEHPETRSKTASWVDFNRSSVPLIEIVSKPDLSSPEEAVAYLKKLVLILRYLEICDCNMEEGSLRCDANISLKPAGSGELGTRAEIKNINSFRHVEKALHFEISRQRDILDGGGRIVQETRLWNDDKGQTASMRSKEEAHDYRYFPDPDLVPIKVDAVWKEKIAATLPELPDAKAARFAASYELPIYDISVLTSSKRLADYFEATVSHYPQPKKVANFINNDLMRYLKDPDVELPSFKVPPKEVGQLLQKVESGELSGKMAKEIFATAIATGQSPSTLAGQQGATQISDTGELEKILDSVLAQNPKQVADFRAGKEKILGFLVGQLMKATQGKANPAVAQELLIKKLNHK